MTPESIAIIIMSVVLAGLVLTTLVFRLKYRKLVMTVAKLVIDKEVLLDKIDSLILESSDEANESFIKFLSDSREAAFGYIEDVQVSLKNYVTAMESGTEDEVVTARMELLSYLPDAT